jgi:hypothetical protein
MEGQQHLVKKNQISTTNVLPATHATTDTRTADVAAARLHACLSGIHLCPTPRCFVAGSKRVAGAAAAQPQSKEGTHSTRPQPMHVTPTHSTSLSGPSTAAYIMHNARP